MANFSKSFNFRNGLQVDDDKLIVKPNTGLVGIGSTIPTEVLDVKGNIKSSGIVTSPNIVAGTGVTVGTGVNQISLDGVTGIITAKNYFGDGSTLTNVVAIATAGFKELSGTLSTSFSVGIGSLNVGGVGVTIGKFPDFTLDVIGDMRVTGPSTFTGITTISDLFANTLSVSDASLFDDVLVSGASTFTGISTNTSLIQANGLEVAGVSTFIDNVLFRGDGIVNFGQPFGNSPRGSYVVFHGGHSTGRNMTWDGGSLIFDDMAKARFGDLGIKDMELWHNGGNANIKFDGGLSINSYGKGDVSIDSGLSVVGVSTLRNIEVTGVSTFIGITTYSDGLIVTAGVSTFNDAIDANAGATLNQLNITGVSTLTGRVTANEINSNQLKLLQNGTQVLNTIGAGVSVSNTLSVISLNGGSSGLSSSSGSLRYGNQSASAPYSTRRSLDLINNDSGNVNFYLNASDLDVPFDGSDFHWHKGFNNTRLMTLTGIGGSLGIGITTPSSKLHVLGTANITGATDIGGNLDVSGDLTVGGSFNSDVVGNVTGSLTGDILAGIATFNNGLLISGVTTSTNVKTDRLSINTNSVSQQLQINSGDNQVFVSVNGNLGIKTDETYGNTIFNTGSSISNLVGIGTTITRSAVDFTDAGKNVTGVFANRMYMLPPKITTSERNSLAGLSNGALIFNTDGNQLQVYIDGWVGIGTTTKVDS